MHAFTREEVGFVLAAARTAFAKFYPVVLFLFETGARKSEAINLPWANVVFEQKVARIWSSTSADENDDDDDTEAYMVKSVEREVPLSDQMLVVLETQKLAGLSAEWVFPATTDRCHTKGERYAFFPKYTWTRLLAKATELRRAPAVKAAREQGLTVEEAAAQAATVVPEITGGPHKARHTYASHFLAVKPDLFLLGRVLGHSHTRVTELYSHLLPDHLAAARGVVTFVAAADASTG